MKINTVARTKLGVYSCHSLRIAENQEYDKDKIHIFCPGLLKTNSFLFSSFLIFFVFPFFVFFFGFFYFFWIFSIFLNFFYFFGFSFFTTSRGCLLNWAYDPQAAKSGSHPLSSGLTSNCQYFFIFYLGLPLTASSFHFLFGLTSNGQFL